MYSAFLLSEKFSINWVFEASEDFSKRIKNLTELGFKAKYVISDGIARPQKIISKGYEPIKTATELKENRGLYENIAMGDLIEFLKNKEKIVRSIFLEKNE